MSELVRVERAGDVLRVTLNRPDVRNALSGELLLQLRAAFEEAAEDTSVRAAVLAGEGKDFCAGADLGEMKKLGAATKDENRADAQRLSAAFASIEAFPRPVIGRVQGNVFGGGAGLVAACDISVVARDARFAFSEVRLGIIPAVISPYVVRRLGAGRARQLFLTGERFDGATAAAYGLAAEAVEADALDERVDALLELILAGSPDAQRRIKLLVRAVSERDLEEAAAMTPQFIADARASEEGQEGLLAFQEKRKPNWVPEAES